MQMAMVSVKDAFVAAWRSHRIAQGDAPETLPDPLGEGRRRRQRTRQGQRQHGIQQDTGAEDRQAGSILAGDAEQKAGGFFLDVSESNHGDLSERSGEGGFLLEDDEDDDEAIASPRVDDREETAQTVIPTSIPLASIPDALANLSLSSSDDAVLKLFRSVAVQGEVQEAQGTIDGSRRRRRGEGREADKVVTFQDFDRIVQVLVAGQKQMGTERVGSSGSAEESDDANSKARRRPRRAAAAWGLKKLRAAGMHDDEDDLDEEDSDDEDAFRMEADEDEEADQSNDAKDFRAVPARRKRGNASKGSTRSTSRSVQTVRKRRKGRDEYSDASSNDDSSEESNQSKLNTHQRRQVRAAFELVTNRLKDVRRGATQAYSSPEDERISKEDLRALVRAVGEKIPEKEIDEMIDEGLHYFASASSATATKQSAKLRREAASGRAAASGQAGQGPTLGIDEFAGILLRGRLI